MKNSFLNIYKNKKIIITGHTGFNGAWLTYTLYLMGANILGISKNILTKPSLFNALNLQKKVRSKFMDIQNFKKINRIFSIEKPDFIFHLAGQSLVKKSFEDPRETFLTNSLGTLNIIQALKNLDKKCSSIIITSDKSYLNVEQKKGYKETDRLGGIDPYSASKASAELIINSYHKSFLQKNKKISLVVARAGNVIGGGDWSENRLIPDCIKAWSKNKTVNIRNPKSTRPWQHVLEAVGAYLYLGYLLNVNSKIDGEAFNFGPSYKKNYSTKEVLNNLVKYWPLKAKIKILKKKQFVESNLLKLNCTKAKKIGWKSILSLQETLFLTSTWYKTFYFEKKNIDDFSKGQIEKYFEKYKLKIKKI